jgi:hypothetical protein
MKIGPKPELYGAEESGAVDRECSHRVNIARNGRKRSQILYSSLSA